MCLLLNVLAGLSTGPGFVLRRALLVRRVSDQVLVYFSALCLQLVGFQLFILGEVTPLLIITTKAALPAALFMHGLELKTDLGVAHYLEEVRT